MEQEFSPADINTKINEYKEVIMHFAALLENENQALRAYNIDAVTALLEEKNKIGDVLQGNGRLFYQKSGEIQNSGQRSQTEP